MPSVPPGVLIGDFFLATQAFPGGFNIQLGKRCPRWNRSRRTNFWNMVILGAGQGILDPKLGAMANDCGDALGIPDGDTMQTVLNNTGLEGAMKQAMTTIIGIYNDAAMTVLTSGADKVVSYSGIAIGAVVWGGQQLTPSQVPAAVKALQGRHWFNKLQNTVTDFENLLD